MLPRTRTTASLTHPALTRPRPHPRQDDDRSGTITMEEFETALRDLSFQLTKLDYLELFSAVDSDASRVLTMDEVPCAAAIWPPRRALLRCTPAMRRDWAGA